MAERKRTSLENQLGGGGKGQSIKKLLFDIQEQQKELQKELAELKNKEQDRVKSAQSFLLELDKEHHESVNKDAQPAPPPNKPRRSSRINK